MKSSRQLNAEINPTNQDWESVRLLLTTDPHEELTFDLREIEAKTKMRITTD